MTRTDPTPSIAVLVATYNGAATLGAQLSSFSRQTWRPKLVLVSDDGSQDETRAIVSDFAEDNPELQIILVEGPRQGAASNFLSLLQQVPSGIDLVAFADQDDVWLEEKLQRGARALTESEGPTLYCARTWECSADLKQRRLSQDRATDPGFAHAIVQNIAGGNTMMLNRAAWVQLAEASYEAGRVVIHDWWIYQIITGMGGRVIYDPEPVLLYRQHGRNSIGANRGLCAKYRRAHSLLTGGYSAWSRTNVAALRASAHRFTPENRALLERFAEGRSAGLRNRVAMLRQTGIRRHGSEGRLALWAAVLLNRL